MTKRKIKILPLSALESPNVKHLWDNYYLNRIGEVYSVKLGKVYVLRPYFSNGCLYAKLNQQVVNIRREMYRLFIGNVPDNAIVVTKNGSKTDLNVNNLMLLKRTAPKRLYQRISNRKYIICLDDGKIYKSAVECGKAYGYTASMINFMAKGKRNGYVRLQRLKTPVNQNMDVDYPKEYALKLNKKIIFAGTADDICKKLNIGKRTFYNLNQKGKYKVEELELS